MTEHRPAYCAHSGTTGKRQFPPDRSEAQIGHDTALLSRGEPGTIIIVSGSHHHPTSLLYNLGNHSLVITRDADPFELAAPVTDEPTSSRQADVMILDHDEAYRLYRCLHDLLFAPQSGVRAVTVAPGSREVLLPIQTRKDPLP